MTTGVQMFCGCRGQIDNTMGDLGISDLRDADGWSAFAAILEKLYLRAPTPQADLGVCNCNVCMAPEFAAEMRTTNPRNLTTQQVEEWLRAVPSDANPDTLLWILPRILEFVATGQYCCPDEFDDAEERLLRGMHHAKYPQGWSSADIALVDEAAQTMVMAAANAREPGLDNLLCALNEGRIDIQPILIALRSLSDGHLAEIFHALWVCKDQHSSTRNRIEPCMYWKTEPGWSAASEFYTGQDMEDRMTTAGLAGNDIAVEVSDLIADWRSNYRR